MLEALVFVVFTAALLGFSWPWLRDTRAHGFYRFFAWEFILLLILLNYGRWFDDPFSPRQIASWVLLLASIALAAHGFYLLKTMGAPKGALENTTTLVTRGAYHYIRHPLYTSLLLFGCGAFLKDLSLPALLLALALSAALFATARVEEGEMVCRFGASYTAYMRGTKRFIPFVF